MMAAYTPFRMVRQTLKMMMGAFIMLHLVPLAPFAGAAGYTPLHETRIIDRDVIRLSDVFSSIDPARDQAIGTAPRPGQDMVLNARTLMKLAVAYNVKWQPETTADQVVLRRDGTVIDVSMIEDAVRDALIKSGAPEKFSVTFDSSPAPILLPKGMSTDLDTTQVSYTPEKSAFSLALAPSTQPNRTLTVTGKVEQIIDVPVALETIPKGTIIGATDLTTTEIKASLVKNDANLSADNLVGLTARRNIIAGRPLKASDVEIPISVARGDKITLIYKTGIMELSVQGRALQDGRKGDRVKVVNSDTNKNLQGTVLADNRVMID